LESKLEDAASKNNKLSAKSFEDGLISSGLLLTRPVIHKLYNLLDPENRGVLTVNDVLTFAYGEKASDKQSFRDRPVLGAADDMTHLISRAIRDEICQGSKLYIQSSNLHCLGKFIADCCTEKSGFLTRRAFRKLLANLEIRLREADEDTLFESLDINGEGTIAAEDLLVFMQGEVSDNIFEVSERAAKVYYETLVKNKASAKELLKNLTKYDTKFTGYVDFATFEKVVKKLSGSISWKAEQIVDVARFLDPAKEGRIDCLYATALLFLISDTNRTEAKLKNLFRLMRIKGIKYKDLLLGAADSERHTISLDDILFQIERFLGLPMLRPEFDLVLQKYQRRGVVNVDIFLEAMEGDSENPVKKPARESQKDGESFGRALFKKICALRTNSKLVDDIRKEILSRDDDLKGYITSKDFQRILDKFADFTDEESELLAENMCFTDGTHRNEIDYSLLLLFLMEPIPNSPLDVGITLMNKLMRGADAVGLRRLLSLLYRNYSASDSTHSGLIPRKLCDRILKDECQGVEISNVQELYSAFQDKHSDNCYYPELLAYLGCCSLWNVLHRIHHLDLIRQKQGYHFQEHLMKHHRKGKKIDYSRLRELFQSIGILVPETGFEVIFKMYGGKSKCVDIEKLTSAIENAAKESPEQAKAIERVQAFSKIESDGKCEITQSLLQDYDARIIKAIQISFDIFDHSRHNEILAADLERVIQSVGFNPEINDILELLHKIDRKGTGMLEFNDFMINIMPYLRNLYHSAILLSEERLKNNFQKIDINGNGELSFEELKYALQGIGSTNMDARISDEECSAVISYLDCDNNRTLSWAEFRVIFKVMKDDNLMSELSLTLRKALRKVAIY